MSLDPVTSGTSALPPPKRVRIGLVVLRDFRWFVAEMFYVYDAPEKS